MTRGPKRRMAIWTALALVAGVLALSTTQAGAGDDGPLVQPIEVNLGGQPNDCTTSEVGSAAEYELRIENPQTGPYQPQEGVTIELLVTDDELLNFVVSGAVVYDVVIKGGKKSTHYDYDGSPVGAVTADNNLRAPKKGNKFFSISHTSFCYSLEFDVSGIVYFDNDQSGDFDDDFDDFDDGRTITAYADGEAVQATDSIADGTYEMTLEAGKTYTICQAEVVEGDEDYAQTEPVNENCQALGTSEVGGYDGISGPRANLDFGTAPEVCGDPLDDEVGIFAADFVLFDGGNFESGCDNKVGLLTIEDGQVKLPLVGSGEVAGIGVITKTFDSPDNFVPLEYKQGLLVDSGELDTTFEVLPWCALRGKENGDGTQFDAYLPSGLYPSLVGVSDPDSGDLSVSCKVYVDENAEGIQTTVVLIQDDPFWR